MLVRPVTLIEYVVDVASGADGENVAVSPSVEIVIVPATGCPVLYTFKENEEFVMLNGFMRLLNCT